MKLGGSEKRNFAHGHRDLPIQDVARIPVDDPREIDKSLLEANVGDIRTEDLVRTDNGHILQKIGIDLMVLVPLRQRGLGVDGFQTHQPHQTKNAFWVDGIPLGPEPGRHPPIAIPMILSFPEDDIWVLSQAVIRR